MKSYRDLIVWQKAMALVKEIYSLITVFPKAETYALSDQLKRAAVSVPSNIAEGYGRQSTKDYIHFLNIARGSVYEVDTQLCIAIMLEYLTPEEAQKAFGLVEEVGKMLNSISAKLMPDA